MKTRNTKRKIAETVVGAAIGAAIAGPAGAVAGGLVGSHAAAHTRQRAKTKRMPKRRKQDAFDLLVHAELKRILVPLDFSPASRQTLLFARNWAARFGSEILLLHVIEPMNTYSVLGAESVALPVASADLHGPTRSELEKLAAKVFPRKAKVSVHLRDGAAYDEITTAARELDVNLIIIATHGRTGLSHILLGSTAERVVRHAPCPVLTLRCAG